MTLRIQDLYTFFIVARAGTMQQAANELKVTPGAVSQRISALEDRSGTRLFNRSKQGLSRTAAGESLWSDTHAAFGTLERAHDRLRSKSDLFRVRVSTTVSFASACLVPRLGDFTRQFPDIRVSIETDDQLTDLRHEPIDVAIRHGLGVYPGLSATWISTPKLVVLASPTLIKSSKPLNTPEDCLDFTLIQDINSADWPLWFESHGIDSRSAKLGPAFDNDHLIVRAALAGQGLALICDLCAEDQLRRGELIKILDYDRRTKFAYYAVTMPATLEKPAVRIFIDWLRDAVAGDQRFVA